MAGMALSCAVLLSFRCAMDFSGAFLAVECRSGLTEPNPFLGFRCSQGGIAVSRIQADKDSGPLSWLSCAMICRPLLRWARQQCLRRVHSKPSCRVTVAISCHLPPCWHPAGMLKGTWSGLRRSMTSCAFMEASKVVLESANEFG